MATSIVTQYPEILEGVPGGYWIIWKRPGLGAKYALESLNISTSNDLNDIFPAKYLKLFGIERNIRLVRGTTFKSWEELYTKLREKLITVYDAGRVEKIIKYVYITYSDITSGGDVKVVQDTNVLANYTALYVNYSPVHEMERNYEFIFVEPTRLTVFPAIDLNAISSIIFKRPAKLPPNTVSYWGVDSVSVALNQDSLLDNLFSMINEHTINYSQPVQSSDTEQELPNEHFVLSEVPPIYKVPQNPAGIAGILAIRIVAYKNASKFPQMFVGETRANEVPDITDVQYFPVYSEPAQSSTSQVIALPSGGLVPEDGRIQYIMDNVALTILQGTPICLTMFLNACESVSTTPDNIAFQLKMDPIDVIDYVAKYFTRLGIQNIHVVGKPYTRTERSAIVRSILIDGVFPPALRKKENGDAIDALNANIQIYVKWYKLVQLYEDNLYVDHSILLEQATRLSKGLSFEKGMLFIPSTTDGITSLEEFEAFIRSTEPWEVLTPVLPTILDFIDTAMQLSNTVPYYTLDVSKGTFFVNPNYVKLATDIDRYMLPTLGTSDWRRYNFLYDCIPFIDIMRLSQYPSFPCESWKLPFDIIGDYPLIDIPVEPMQTPIALASLKSLRLSDKVDKVQLLQNLANSRMSPFTYEYSMTVPHLNAFLPLNPNLDTLYSVGMNYGNLERKTESVFLPVPDNDVVNTNFKNIIAPLGNFNSLTPLQLENLRTNALVLSIIKADPALIVHFSDVLIARGDFIGNGYDTPPLFSAPLTVKELLNFPKKFDKQDFLANVLQHAFPALPRNALMPSVPTMPSLLEQAPLSIQSSKDIITPQSIMANNLALVPHVQQVLSKLAPKLLDVYDPMIAKNVFNMFESKLVPTNIDESDNSIKKAVALAFSIANADLLHSALLDIAKESEPGSPLQVFSENSDLVKWDNLPFIKEDFDLLQSVSLSAKAESGPTLLETITESTLTPPSVSVPQIPLSTRIKENDGYRKMEANLVNLDNAITRLGISKPKEQTLLQAEFDKIAPQLAQLDSFPQDSDQIMPLASAIVSLIQSIDENSSDVLDELKKIPAERIQSLADKTNEIDLDYRPYVSGKASYTKFELDKLNIAHNALIEARKGAYGKQAEYDLLFSAFVKAASEAKSYLLRNDARKQKINELTNALANLKNRLSPIELQHMSTDATNQFSTTINALNELNKQGEVLSDDEFTQKTLATEKMIYDVWFAMKQSRDYYWKKQQDILDAEAARKLADEELLREQKEAADLKRQQEQEEQRLENEALAIQQKESLRIARLKAEQEALELQEANEFIAQLKKQEDEALQKSKFEQDLERIRNKIQKDMVEIEYEKELSGIVLKNEHLSIGEDTLRITRNTQYDDITRLATIVNSDNIRTTNDLTDAYNAYEVGTKDILEIPKSLWSMIQEKTKSKRDIIQSLLATDSSMLSVTPKFKNYANMKIDDVGYNDMLRVSRALETILNDIIRIYTESNFLANLQTSSILYDLPFPPKGMNDAIAGDKLRIGLKLEDDDVLFRKLSDLFKDIVPAPPEFLNYFPNANSRNRLYVKTSAISSTGAQSSKVTYGTYAIIHVNAKEWKVFDDNRKDWSAGEYPTALSAYESLEENSPLLFLEDASDIENMWTAIMLKYPPTSNELNTFNNIINSILSEISNSVKTIHDTPPPQNLPDQQQLDVLVAGPNYLQYQPFIDVVKYRLGLCKQACQIRKNRTYQEFIASSKSSTSQNIYSHWKKFYETEISVTNTLPPTIPTEIIDLNVAILNRLIELAPEKEPTKTTITPSLRKIPPVKKKKSVAFKI